MTKKIIKVGSRDSQLALWQTRYAIEQLKKVFTDTEFEIVDLKTKGDKILDVSLSKIGDKGLFTNELEAMMLSGEIDMAVHSLKDMPTSLPERSVTGSAPRFIRLSSRAAAITGSRWSMVTTRSDIISDIFMLSPPAAIVARNMRG